MASVAPVTRIEHNDLTFTVISSRTILTKRFGRNPDGSLRKTGRPSLTHGIARRHAVASLAELAEFLETLSQTQACAWGVTGHDEIQLRTREALARITENRHSYIARTNEHFHWPDGPGIWMLDIDPAPDQPTPGPEEIVNTLRSLHPVLESATFLWRPSASSGVGDCGIVGQRLYLATTDPSCARKAGAALVDLLWIANRGWIQITASGDRINRTWIDTATWSPAWLDYVAKPFLEDGVVRQHIPHRLFPGEEPVDLQALIDAHTPEVRDQARLLQQEARLAALPEAERVAAAYDAEHGLEGPRATRGRDLGYLEADFLLIAQDGSLRTPRELLQDPVRWHGAKFHDPLEPTYNDNDPRIATVYLLNEETPHVFSWAHHGRRWSLESPDLAFENIAWIDSGGSRERAIPAWRADLAGLRQADRERVSSRPDYRVPFPTIREAILDSRVLSVQAGVGTGKTTTALDLVVETLQADDDETLLVYTTPTKTNLNYFVQLVKERITSDQNLRLSVEMGGSRDALPLVSRKTGERPYRVVVATHAKLLQLGDNPNAQAGLLRRLVNAKEIAQDSDKPLAIFTLIDEGDAYLASLVRSVPLGYRYGVYTDRSTGKPHRRIHRACPATCGNCELQEWVLQGLTVRPDGIEQYSLVQRAVLIESADVLEPGGFETLRQALLDPETRGQYQARRIERSRIPLDEISYEHVFTDDNGKLKTETRVSLQGVLHHMASQHGASVRRAFAVDVHTGEQVDNPEERNRRDLLFPKRACKVPHLVTWNSGLESPLRMLADVSDVRFLSATFSQNSRDMMTYVFRERVHASVELSPDDGSHLVSDVLILVTSRARTRRDHLETLVGAGKVLAIYPKKQQASAARDRLQKDIAPGQKGTLLVGSWEGNTRILERVRGEPNVFLTYARASAARGANLGQFRIVISKSGQDSAAMDELALDGDVFAAVEETRRSLVSQNTGRILRRDPDDPEDTGRRVIVVESTIDPVRGSLTDTYAWLESSVRRVSAGRIERRVLAVHPLRYIEAATEFLATGQCSVTDEVDSETRTMSQSQRKRLQALNVSPREQSRTTRRQESRQRKIDALEELRKQHVSWREAQRKTNLNRIFSSDEIRHLREQYTVGEDLECD